MSQYFFPFFKNSNRLSDGCEKNNLLDDDNNLLADKSLLRNVRAKKKECYLCYLDHYGGQKKPDAQSSFHAEYLFLDDGRQKKYLQAKREQQH